MGTLYLKSDRLARGLTRQTPAFISPLSQVSRSCLTLSQPHPFWVPERTRGDNHGNIRPFVPDSPNQNCTESHRQSLHSAETHAIQELQKKPSESPRF
jgi:hypothetical protein